MTKIYLCEADQLEVGIMKPFCIGYRYEIIVINFGDKIGGYSRFCPHMNIPIDYKGTIKDGFIMCNEHGIPFCPITGAPQRLQRKCGNLSLYKITTENGKVYVDVPDNYMWESN